MIKNQKQAEAARRKIVELTEAFEAFEIEHSNKNTAKYRLGKNAFSELIKDLTDQVSTYEALVNGDFHCWQPKSLKEISNVLISARLAQKKSQKELADLLNIQEQQIQRYESTDYETAALPKIVQVAMALNLKFYFEKVIIINGNSFDCPENLTPELVEAGKQKVKNNKSLMAF